MRDNARDVEAGESGRRERDQAGLCKKGQRVLNAAGRSAEMGASADQVGSVDDGQSDDPRSKATRGPANVADSRKKLFRAEGIPGKA